MKAVELRVLLEGAGWMMLSSSDDPTRRYFVPPAAHSAAGLVWIPAREEDEVAEDDESWVKFRLRVSQQPIA